MLALEKHAIYLWVCYFPPPSASKQNKAEKKGMERGRKFAALMSILGGIPLKILTTHFYCMFDFSFSGSLIYPWSYCNLLIINLNKPSVQSDLLLFYLPSCDSTCVVGITVAVGVVVGFVTVAGVTIGRILALGVDLFPAIAAAVTLLGVETTGVGLILAVGGSDVLALTEGKMQE